MVYTAEVVGAGERVKLDPIQFKKIQDALVTANTVASTSAYGQVKKGVAVVNATDAASALTQLNALLAALRTSGVIS